LLLKVRRKAKAIGGSYKGSAATGSASYGAYDIGRVLPPGEYYRRKPQGAATGEQTECRHRGNIIGGSHRVLLPGDRRSAATKGTSYGAYDIGRVLPPGEYYRREL